jgi:hypothetical protein
MAIATKNVRNTQNRSELLKIIGLLRARVGRHILHRLPEINCEVKATFGLIQFRFSIEHERKVAQPYFAPASASVPNEGEPG